MSTRIYCDGCGMPVGTTMEPNYWRCTLMGDVTMSAGGKILDTTGMRHYTGKKSHNAHDPIRQADVCLHCVSKIQEEN